MTSTEVRTYAVGDVIPQDERVPTSGWCEEAVRGGYYCSLRKGHGGSQHVAAYSNGTVVAVAERDTSGDPIVEQPTPQVLAERLAQAERELVMVRESRTAVENELQRLSTIRDSLVADRDRVAAEHEAFRARVVETAMRYAKAHDWCSVVRQALIEMGLDVTSRYRVAVTVMAYREVTVEVEATDGSEAWRQVDRMNESELAALIDASPEGSAYRFYGNDAWSHSSHDSSTSTEQVED